jgi:hypothetical protein
LQFKKTDFGPILSQSQRRHGRLLESVHTATHGAKMMKTFVTLGAAAALLGLAGCQSIPLTAQDQGGSAQASMIAPMVEKRDTLVGTGYAVISVQNHKLPAQQRLMAIRASKLEAYRSLTEQVYGQYLDATTTVSDMVVKSDSFRSRVEGVIYGAVLVSITPVGDDTYETTLSLDRSVVNDLRALYLGQLVARKKP